MKSEHLKGPPLRLGDVQVINAVAAGLDSRRQRDLRRPAAFIVDEGGQTQLLVMSTGDTFGDLQANALLFLGAPRLYRALAGLLQASQASDLECGDLTREDAAMRVLTKAEGEAQAALTAAQPNDGGL